jgi:two-component system sensor histidine kinase/response regulator
VNAEQQMPPAPAGGRIMVVDDEERNRRLLADLLTAKGYTVRTANDGLSALLLAAEFQPEAILLDIMMPDLDGVEVCRRLKADPATASIPVLLATALYEQADRMRGLQAGANDFLAKPLDIDEVSSRVKNAVHMKGLHDRLQESYRDLKKLEGLRDRLTHMIVHDLRSPLMVMSMSLELVLQEDTRLSPDQQSMLAMVQNSCEQLIEMVSSLLDVSRMESGQMPLHLSSCDLGEAARAAAESMTVAAQQRQLALHVTGAAEPCSMDGVLVQRVIVNLLGNAIKFAPSGTAIELEVSSTGDAARCSVTDSGRGIPPDYQQRIFEKFGQGEVQKQDRKHSTGLGLAFCKLAVEAHGGKIGVISEVGKGSTFWFTLPAAGAKAESGSGNAELGTGKAAGGTGC